MTLLFISDYSTYLCRNSALEGRKGNGLQKRKCTICTCEEISIIYVSKLNPYENKCPSSLPFTPPFPSFPLPPSLLFSFLPSFLPAFLHFFLPSFLFLRNLNSFVKSRLRNVSLISPGSGRIYLRRICQANFSFMLTSISFLYIIIARHPKNDYDYI